MEPSCCGFCDVTCSCPDFRTDFFRKQPVGRTQYRRIITRLLGLGDIVLPPAPGCVPFSEQECPPIPSDRSIKENFSAVDEQAILNKVAKLHIKTWTYTDREQGVRHIGPMAQDFMASFNVGDSDRHIHMVDANGVNLAAIKALNTKLEEKDGQIHELHEKLGEIMSRLDKLS